VPSILKIKRWCGVASLVSVVLLGGVAVVGAQPTERAAAEGIPTPESVLGFRVGDDFKLASYDQSIEYFQALAAASDRVELRRIGKTSEGRDWYIALISSAENLARVERIREISLRLAHPVGLDEVEARQLAAKSTVIVAIDGGLHATETAHAQHTIQLAYDLVTEKDGSTARAILDNVVLLLWPSINPDGQNMVAAWYAENLGTPFETSRLPWLYQKYVGHDNNRDGYGINMIESRVAIRVEREWEPQVIYSHHMTSTFPSTIWLPPYSDPIFPSVHPLMNRMVNLMGTAAAAALDARGLPGADHRGEVYDAWYPGYIDFINFFHNIVVMFSETGLHASPTPRFYTVADFPEADRALQPGTLHASLWRGGWWRLRDSVEYMLTTSTATLDIAAKFREQILYNRYQAARDTIAAYREGPPYAYFVPQDQRDPVAAVEMLRRLAFQSVAVHQLTEDVEFERHSYKAGTWVVAMDQSTGGFAQALLSVQRYPDLRQYPDGPPDLPYDHAGWTLPYQMDVRVVAAGSPLTTALRDVMAPLTATATPWDTPGDAAPFDSVPGVGFDTNPIAKAIVPKAGRTRGSGSVLRLDPAQNNTFRALNTALETGGTVRYSPATDARGGAYEISGLDASSIEALVADLALQAERTAAGRNAGSAGIPIRKTRIGLYRPWQPSIDEGWTRWLLEQYGFTPTSLRNADVVAGNLGERYDVIVLADIGRRSIVDGAAIGSMPKRYTGGIGAEGVRAIDQFVRAGGTLVCLNRSTLFAIDELHLPVRNAVAELERSEFFSSGSILEVLVDLSHPVLAGMPERAKITVTNSPVFTTTADFEGTALAKYADAGSPLLSGYLLGEEHLHGHAAALDVFHGEGHVLLFGLRPQWRAQPFGTFRLLFNSLLYHSELAASGQANPDFWQPRAEEEAEEESGEEENEDTEAR